MGDDFLAGLYLSEGRLVKPFDYSFLSKNAYYFVAPHGTAKHPALEAFRNWLIRSIDRLRADSGARRGDDTRESAEPTLPSLSDHRSPAERQNVA